MLRRMILAVLLFAAVANADINIEFRTDSPVIQVGETADVRMYLVSDPPQEFISFQMLLAWEPTLLFFDSYVTNASGIMDGFPTFDPWGINESNPPLDGEGLYFFVGPFVNQFEATPDGLLIATLTFEALSGTAGTDVGFFTHPEANTIVYGASNVDLTGDLIPVTLQIGGDSPPPCEPVDDGDDCTVDVCIDGVPENVPVNCDDDDLCTDDVCTAGACDNVPIDCDDCETCVAGECVGQDCPPCDTCPQCDDCCAECEVCEVCEECEVCQEPPVVTIYNVSIEDLQELVDILDGDVEGTCTVVNIE